MHDDMIAAACWRLPQTVEKTTTRAFLRKTGAFGHLDSMVPKFAARSSSKQKSHPSVLDGKAVDDLQLCPNVGSRNG